MIALNEATLSGKIAPHFKLSTAMTLTVLNASMLVVVLFVLFRHSDTTLIVATNATVKSPEVEYKDYVAILLTALAVMIALGSVLVAFLAVLGYAEGRNLIERNVQRTVQEMIDLWLKGRWQRAPKSPPLQTT